MIMWKKVTRMGIQAGFEDSLYLQPGHRHVNIRENYPGQTVYRDGDPFPGNGAAGKRPYGGNGAG